MLKLPPLNSLRAFEATGRLLSISRAADELNVTAGAISQQIRSLEEYLQLKLFKRLNRAIVLTDAGQLFLPLISDGFDRFAQAIQLLDSHNCCGPLTISSAPSFIAKWLIPRLHKFKTIHPDIDVRIDASTRLTDFAREDIDVGIRFGDGKYPELDCVLLFSFDLIVVCSPLLLKKGGGLSQVSDLRKYTLLHGNHADLDDGYPDWAMWLAVVEASDVDATHGIYFNQTELLMQAALDGQGVALVAGVLAETEIAAGRLIQPFATRLPVKLNYHLVTTPQKAKIAKIAAFREWVLQESAYLREPQTAAMASLS